MAVGASFSSTSAKVAAKKGSPGASYAQTNAAAKPAGGSFTQTSATTGSGTTPTPAPNTPPAQQYKTVTTTNPVAPFLTPDQQAAMDKDYYTTMGNIAGWQSQYDSAPLTEGNAEAAQNYKAAVSIANQNALDAARGILSGGVHLGNLSDINATLNQNLGTLRTNLSNLQSQLSGQIGNAQTGWGQEVADYNGIKAANAAGQTPTTTTTRVPVQSQPAQQLDTTTGVQDIKPTGHPTSQGVTAHPAPAGASFTQTSAAAKPAGGSFQQTSATNGPAAIRIVRRQGW